MVSVLKIKKEIFQSNFKSGSLKDTKRKSTILLAYSSKSCTVSFMSEKTDILTLQLQTFSEKYHFFYK